MKYCYYCILKSNSESFAVLCYNRFSHRDDYGYSYIIVLLLRNLHTLQKRRLQLNAVFVFNFFCVCFKLCPSTMDLVSL